MALFMAKVYILAVFTVTIGPTYSSTIPIMCSIETWHLNLAGCPGNSGGHMEKLWFCINCKVNEEISVHLVMAYFPARAPGWMAQST